MFVAITASGLPPGECQHWVKDGIKSQDRPNRPSFVQAAAVAFPMVPPSAARTLLS
jgi:hypothetical protein